MHYLACACITLGAPEACKLGAAALHGTEGASTCTISLLKSRLVPFAAAGNGMMQLRNACTDRVGKADGQQLPRSASADAGASCLVQNALLSIIMLSKSPS